MRLPAGARPVSIAASAAEKPHGFPLRHKAPLVRGSPEAGAAARSRSSSSPLNAAEDDAFFPTERDARAFVEACGCRILLAESRRRVSGKSLLGFRWIGLG